MKKWTLFFASLMLLVLNVVGTPKSYAGDKLMSSSFDSVRIYYAMDTITGIASSIVLNVTVVTPGRLHMENIVFLRVRGYASAYFLDGVGPGTNSGYNGL